MEGRKLRHEAEPLGTEEALPTATRRFHQRLQNLTRFVAVHRVEAGNLPSERHLLRSPQLCWHLSGPATCHHVPVLSVARSPRQPTAAAGARLGGRKQGAAPACLLGRGVVSRAAARYSSEEKLKTGVQPRRTL